MVSGLIGRERLAKLVAQLDQTGAAREAALNGIEAHLRKNGQKFVDLAEALIGPEPKAEESGRSVAKPAPADPLKGPYIHEPLFRGGFFSRKTFNGKPVIQNVRPPAGSRGRLRVLKDEESYGVHRLTLSLETAHELYEPFTVYAEGHEEHYKAIARSSCNGNPAVF